MAYTPLLGGGGAPNFPLQFPDARPELMSLAVTPIELLANDGSGHVISHGTGFFWRVDSRVFLVTARHVVSGVNPFDDSVMSETGFLPEIIRCFPSGYVDDSRRIVARHVGIELPVRIDHQPQWLEDPRFSELRTDIAAVELSFDNLSLVICVNDAPDIFSDIVSLVGFECSILGYPTANFGGLKTPVWRRGTIASDPSLPVDGKPMFLLDASTSPGFSGGPVFRRHSGPAPRRMADGQIEIDASKVLTTAFVGVYCGRFQHAYVGGEVPFVFYGNRIQEILGRRAQNSG